MDSKWLTVNLLLCAFRKALANSKAEVLQSLISNITAYKKLDQLQDSLRDAVVHGRGGVARWLLSIGVKLGPPGGSTYTDLRWALIRAACEGLQDVFLQVLNFHSDCNEIDRIGSICVMCAVRLGRVNVFRMLHGMDVTLDMAYGPTALLYVAAEYTGAELFRILGFDRRGLQECRGLR